MVVFRCGDISSIRRYRFLKNSRTTFFAYDSGIRIDLILDYFELYFRIYSNLGWEISENNYSNKLDLYSLQIFQNWLDYLPEDGFNAV